MTTIELYHPHEGEPDQRSRGERVIDDRLQICGSDFLFYPARKLVGEKIKTNLRELELVRIIGNSVGTADLILRDDEGRFFRSDGDKYELRLVRSATTEAWIEHLCESND